MEGMTMPRMITVACSQDSHASIRANRAKFVAATVFRGWQQDVDGSYFEMRNCKGCKSSLSDGTRRPAEVAHVA